MADVKRHQRGVILILFALMLIPILGMAALAIDLGLAYIFNSQVESASSLAALAALKMLGTSGSTIT